MKDNAMKSKLLSLALIGLFVSGLMFPATSNDKSATAGDSTAKAGQIAIGGDTVPITLDSAHQVIVYYLHGTRRCSNCIKIENYTKEAIDSAFGEALRDRHLVWRVLNTDEDSNSHYIDDYKLYTKSVVIAEMHFGKQTRYKNLEKIWEHLTDKEAFKKYICEEVALFLKVD
jgi:hypothetical protein